MTDFSAIKKRFPIFTNQPNLVFLDSGASTQKPQAVINAITELYTQYYANVHRGIYKNSERATDMFEAVRGKVQKLIGAAHEQEIIFTKGTTESLNTIAYTWGERNIQAGDEIVVSLLEHHANFIPWQQLCQRKGATFKIAMPEKDGTLSVEAVKKQLTPKTKLVAITHVSNVLGVITPVRAITAAAHKVGAKVVVDAAQSIAHLPVNVQDIDCDFLVFSGHKMYGPTGVGILYGKRELLENMEPFMFGGNMINEVTIERSTWAPVPEKFEGGTPAIAEVIALAPAIDLLQEVGFDAIRAHEKELLTYALQQLATLPDITIYGPQDADKISGVISFNLDTVHPHDTGTLVDEKDVAIRVGHHCAQPLTNFLGVIGTCRASFAIYNTKADVDRLINALKHAQKVFK